MWSENFEAKILNRSEAKNVKRKKEKKSEKSKKYTWISLRFVCFEAKITKVKRNKKFEAKISEKIEVKFYSEQAKHMWNGSNFALFRL